MRLLAVAVVVVLLRTLALGAAVDLGPSQGSWAAALLALGLGAGLWWRPRDPTLTDALGVALLVPLQGPLRDLVQGAVGSGQAGTLAAAGVSLGPVAFLLGRQLQGQLRGGAVALMAGWALGEIAVLSGMLGRVPGPVLGVAVAGVLALCAWARRPDADEVKAEADAVGDRPVSASPAALVLGFATTTLVVVVARVLPSYVEPAPGHDSSIVATLLLLALLVALPAGVLAGHGFGARVLVALGGLGLGAAVLTTQDVLGLYLDQGHVALGRELRDWRALAEGWAPFLLDWDMWVLSTSGLVAAALGLAVGGFRGGAAGPFTVGVALGLAGESWIEADPTYGPAALLLAASGAGVLAAPLSLAPRLGWLLLPVVALPFWMRPLADQPGFDEIRRPGEYSAEGFQRNIMLDASMFSTPGRGTSSTEGLVAYDQTFIGRDPLLPVPPADAAEPAEPSADTEDFVEGGLRRYYGMRASGVPLHGGHPAVGPEGSLGRLARLFVRPGRVLVAGTGSELLAADLTTAGLADSAVVASPLRGHDEAHYRALVLLLFDLLGLSGFEGRVIPDPIRAVTALAPDDLFDTILVVPGRAAWPDTDAQLTETHLQRLADRLAPGGRCLVGIDTSDLGERAISARLAAFGAVFGDRSGAFLEARELDPPFLSMLGWIDAAGRPSVDEVEARLPLAWHQGWRSRLVDADDLAAMLLLDGAGMARLAADEVVHDRGRPVVADRASETGWAAVEGVLDPSARLSLVLAGGRVEPRPLPALFAGLARHARYSYHLAHVNQFAVDVLGDIDWEAFEAEADAYAAAADQDPDHPILHLALAALMEPLALHSEFQRCDQILQRIDISGMRSWRLAMVEAVLHDAALDPEGARLAVERARAVLLAATQTTDR